MEAPFVLTVLLDEQSQQFFNVKRAQYFPPERNFLQAHLTLFHHLTNEALVVDAITSLCAPQQTIKLNVTQLVSIGKGVAYKIISGELVQIHKKLQHIWRPLLTPQDAQGLWPHITIQNKVTPAIATNTRQILEEAFEPFTAYAQGLVLWKYLNGPWELYQQFLFKS